MSQCPCGTTIDYLACCSKYHQEEALPETPETLMRSRYTAYSQANIDYIKKTMQGKPLTGFDERETKFWAESVHWMGLTIIEAHQPEANDQLGFVEFIATFLEKGWIKTIHEISKFERINGRWFYIDGQHKADLKPQKIAPNVTCPCGSKKTFKNCHG